MDLGGNLVLNNQHWNERVSDDTGTKQSLQMQITDRILYLCA